MKKSKKFLSVLLTICMVLSLAAPAFAAASNSDDVQQVRVVSVGDNGSTEEYSVSVSIPKDASETEESRLLFDAAYDVAGMSSARSARTMDNPIISDSNARIISADPQNSGTYIGTSAPLDGLYSKVAVKITITDGSCKRLNASLRNAIGDSSTWAGTKDLAPDTTTIFLYHHGTHDGDVLNLTKGSILSLYCSTGTTEDSDGEIYASVEAEIS